MEDIFSAGMDPTVVKTFQNFQRDLLVVAKGGQAVLDVSPLHDAVDRLHKSLEDTWKARVAKLTAQYPAEIKKGMVFVNKLYDGYYEIVDGPKLSTNQNLKGEEAIYFDVLLWTGKEKVNPQPTMISRAQMAKLGLKFLKS
jgi:hypothetical protein